MSKKQTPLRYEIDFEIKNIKELMDSNIFEYSNIILCGKYMGLYILLKMSAMGEDFKEFPKMIMDMGYMQRI